MAEKIFITAFNGPGSSPRALLGERVIAEMCLREPNPSMPFEFEGVLVEDEGDDFDPHYYWQVEGGSFGHVVLPEGSEPDEEDRLGMIAYQSMVRGIRVQFEGHEISFLDDVLSLPRIYDNACLSFAVLATAATSVTVRGNITCVYG